MRRSRLLASVLATGNLRYQAWLRNYLSSLVTSWGMDDASGTAMVDAVNGYNGTYNGVTLNDRVSMFGTKSVRLDGADYIGLPWASLETSLNKSEFSIGGGLYLDDWRNAIEQDALILQTNTADYVTIFAIGGTFRATVKGGGVARSNYINAAVSSEMTEVSFVLSFKASDRVDLFVNGCLAPTIAGALAPALTGAINGGAIGTALNLTKKVTGNTSQWWVRNSVTTQAEARAIARTTRVISILGDSISAWTNENWVSLLQARLSGVVGICNHAVSSMGVIVGASNMDVQTTAAAGDDADTIIVALGTNDDNAGDMNALQAEYEENLAELKTSNPRATIYAMNVLPKWTAVDGLVEVDKANIRAAIAAACTAQGVTCWDTYTTPWITAADTTDGIHPTAAGYAKITTEVLARI